MDLQRNSSKRPWRWRLLLFAGILLAAGIGWYLCVQPAATPPQIAAGDVEPVVAEALASARRNVLEHPRSGPDWGHLGMVLRAHEFGAEANRCFAEAERLDPTEPRWPYLHGLTLLLSDTPAALALLERAVELCGDSPPEPRFRLAETLLAQGQLDAALAHFRHLLEQHPDHPRALLGLGRLEFERDDLPAATQYLRRVADSPYAHKSASTLLAQIYRRQGDLKALHELGPLADFAEDRQWTDPFVEEVEQLNVGTRARLAYADRLFRQGRSKEAVPLIKEILDRDAGPTAAWIALGSAHFNLQDYAAAAQAFRKASQLSPDSLEAAFKVGVAYYKNDDYRQAAQWFRKAIHLQPTYALAHYNLGHCLKLQGERTAAAAAFREALRYRPNYTLAQEALEKLLAEP
jgi:tetratricopeptide (TPR) repeat protein